MVGRRKFIKKSLLSGTFLLPGTLEAVIKDSSPAYRPLILSTWKHGMPANDRAWDTLNATGNILDAVEQGVRVTESDLSNLSVGLQGLPDREGVVTLDASIMKGDGSCGSVSFVRQVKHPITLARKVMEKTPHVMLSGEGARIFAVSEGMPMEEEKLSPRAQKAYAEWKLNADYKPVINVENHDTIGMIGLDARGKMAGSCTTSGLAYKMHGRVGDSPLIGAGLYVDEEVGAATATGLGEAIIRICGSFLIVELMRRGARPIDAITEALERIRKRFELHREHQVAFVAMSKDGDWASGALRPGFRHTITDDQGSRVEDPSMVLIQD